MRYKSFLLTAVCCLPFCGCDEYEYTIRMEPGGDRITRRLTCSENVPDEIRAKLGKLYDRQIDKGVFEGSFGETLPCDVGGFGTYVHLRNPMGDACIYVERSQGKDTQALELEDAFSQLNRLVDILIDWLKMELGEHPNFEKLRAFCDETLREDVKNLLLYGWVAGRASDEADEGFVRIFLYLYERGYFTLDDIARISISTNQEEFALSWLRRTIAEKLEYASTEDAAEELEFLRDPNALQASIERFLASEKLRDRLTQEVRRRTGDPDIVLDPCDVREMMEEVPQTFFGLMFVDIFGSSGHKVNVNLVCPRKPYQTNGQWNEQTKELSWSWQTKSEQLPSVCYAAMGLANESYQKEHFGRVVLQDEEMFRYSFWHKGLSAEQRARWDGFVDSLDGGEDVRAKLESFRFENVVPPIADSNEAPKLLSDLPRDLIGQALNAKEEGGVDLKIPEAAETQAQSYTVHSIGTVQKKDGRSFIVLDKQYQPGLLGLEKHKYVIVVYWFDRNDTPQKRAILQVHPRADRNNPLTGVFATHAPFRPNLIAITQCDIVDIKENIIEVKDIDAFDGSPVLDLKGDFFRFYNPQTAQKETQ